MDTRQLIADALTKTSADPSFSRFVKVGEYRVIQEQRLSQVAKPRKRDKKTSKGVLASKIYNGVCERAQSDLRALMTSRADAAAYGFSRGKSHVVSLAISLLHILQLSQGDSLYDLSTFCHSCNLTP